MIQNKDYYYKIIETFSNLKNLPVEKELWKNYTMVELMHIFDITKEKGFVKNALILMLACMNENFKDTYEYMSKDISKIMPDERDLFFSCLEQELL